MSQNCGACTAKFLLCAFNFIFFILGTVVLVLGVWLVVDKNSFIELLNTIDHHNVATDFAKPEVVTQLAYVLVVAGSVMFFLSFLGYCGALRESQCLLTTYGIFLMILLVLEVAVAGLAVAYKDQAKQHTREFLKESISKYYVNDLKPDAITLGWNHLMITQKCCGVDNFVDFQNSESWIKNGTRVVPEACCRQNTTGNGPADPTCTTNPTSENSYKDFGCFDRLYEWLEQNSNITIITMIVCILVQLAAIFLAFCLCKSLDYYNSRL